MNYKSYNDLIKDTNKLITQLKDEYELVVSIPRSGNIPASIIALHFNIPYMSIDEWKNGVPNCKYSQRQDNNKTGKVLVIDDSYNSGQRITQAKESLKNWTTKELHFAVIYAPNQNPQLDFYAECVPQPRVFEWNLFNHDIIKRSLIDIDGVVCEDPVISEASHPTQYAEWVTKAKLKKVIKINIGGFVTNRLEQHRDATEQWLTDNGFKFNSLVMAKYKTPSERIAAQRYGKDKAEVYSNSNAVLFIESAVSQAEEIFKLTGRPVYCVDNNTMYKR